jgi:hypothetical protein
MICYKLRDADLGNISGIKIYNHDIVKNYKFEDGINFDVIFNMKLKMDNYEYISEQETIGTHGEERTEFDLFSKYATIGSLTNKSLDWPGTLNHHRIVYETIINQERSRKNIIKIMGIVNGLQNEYNNDNADNYDILREKYEKTKKYIDKLDDGKSISIKNFVKRYLK